MKKITISKWLSVCMLACLGTSASYAQDSVKVKMITNRFRELHNYGLRVPPTWRQKQIMEQVYREFPLPIK